MRIGVFCGSRDRTPAAYRAAARELGERIAAGGHGLVYGGGDSGLMREVARAVRAAGGEIIGVVPSFMMASDAILREGLDLRVVETMSQRKALMTELADAFIVLPGGIGTLEELFEVWTGGALRRHDKPVALLNGDGYFDQLLAFLDRAVADGFLKPAQRAALRVAATPAAALKAVEEAGGHAAGPHTI